MTDADISLRLERFRVWGFRSVRDSGPVPVHGLTALVGRGESGKTTLLHALRGLDPTRKAPYSVERDWPRGLHPRPSGNEVVCAAQFRLPPSLRDDLINEGSIPRRSFGIQVARTYANEYQFWCLDQIGEMERGGHPNAEITESSVDPERILDLLPAILFADRQSILPGYVPLDQSSPRSHAEALRDETGALALLALLESVRNTLGFDSDDWSYSTLRAITEALGPLGVEPGVMPPSGEMWLDLKASRGRLELGLKGADRTQRFDRLDPGRRYWATLEIRVAAAKLYRAGEPVLLLDAPGQSFRGGMRRRLRAALSCSAARGRSVIYTSRMPFHVELQHPEQVLVLNGPVDASSSASTGWRGESRFEVEAALGMQGRSSFLVDSFNLVVEGPTDAAILLALDQWFRRCGELGLPDGLNVVRAGGAFEVSSVAMFLARLGLCAIALFDSDAAGLAGKERLDRLVSEESLERAVQALLVGEVAHLSADAAAIEDLIPPSMYLGVVRDLCPEAVKSRDSITVPLAVEDSSISVPRMIRRAFESRGDHFPKGEVAHTVSRLIADLPSLEAAPRPLVATTQSLFQEIREAADRLSRPHLGDQPGRLETCR